MVTKPRGAATEALEAELRLLRAQARAAHEQLSAARKRIGKLQRELEKEAAPREERTRHPFDFTAEDWREMASKEMIELRLPCVDASLGQEVLDELGMSPDDGEVLLEAIRQSRARQWSALLPVCAAALGGRMDLARSISFEACRSLASGSSQAGAEEAKRVATYMAGDGPRPGASSTATERMFLLLAEEPRLFEQELADAFGPEEAHRLMYSDRLCFNPAMHRFAMRPSGDPRAD